MKHFIRLLAAVATVSIVPLAGCTLESPTIPELSGPSTFGLSVEVSATPDILPQDGVSQSQVTIIALDENGQPKSGVAFRVDTIAFGPNGPVITDYGLLSMRNVTTDANGRAVVTYTAPVAPQAGVDSEEQAAIMVTPIGSDFGTSFQRLVNIRLVPESTAGVAGVPVPNFSFAPLEPVQGQQVVFDASASFDTDGVIVSYVWQYGDGDIETGKVQQHDYGLAGTYVATLTVTDNQGKSASVSKSITVRSPS